MKAIQIRWRQLPAFLSRRIRTTSPAAAAVHVRHFVVAFGAIVSANNLLFLIVATMMATLLVSGLVSRLCLAGLELDFQVPEHVPAGAACPASSSCATTSG